MSANKKRSKKNNQNKKDNIDKKKQTSDKLKSENTLKTEKDKKNVTKDINKENSKKNVTKEIDKKNTEKVSNPENSKNKISKNNTKKTAKKEPVTKEEEIVFKNSKPKSDNKSTGVESKKKASNTSKTNNDKEKTQNLNNEEKIENSKTKNKAEKDKKTTKNENSKIKEETKVKEKEIANTINTPEFFEEKKKKKRKVFLILVNVISALIILLVFSTFFAIIHTIKPTIARGVKIDNIDVSNLTYDEAKEKLEEAFNIVLDNNIEFKYKDYSYVMKSSEISLAYSLNNALEEAYNIGRTGNIIQNNYTILGVAIFNKNIDFKFDYNEEELNKVVDYISTSVPGLVIQYSYYIEGNELIINPGTDGISIKKDELKNKILDTISNRNPIDLIKDCKNTNIDIPYEDVAATAIDIDKIYNEVHTESKDAYYTEKTETTDFAIYPDVDGIDFAVSIDEAKEIIKQTGVTEYVIPLNRTPAQIKINNIGIEAFPDTLSTFSTSYDASNINRSENLRIAASKINGTVILPGETFSFNNVVGERTVADGYRDAKIYSDGQVVDGLAGGICQISSTLYNAVLLANLQVDERYNHSFTTSYVKPGRDATVVYGVKDLKFTNNRKYPIKIGASVSNGVAVFNINGVKEEKEYTVKILPVITATIPYTVQNIVDYTLPVGAVKVSQAGAPGYRVTTYKEVSLNGAIVSKEVISNDVYKVMTRILKVGPAQ